jgi:hypothetical protein
MRQAFDHQPRHGQKDQCLPGGWQLLIVFRHAYRQHQSGEGALDVSTIMLSSRHCLLWSRRMTYLL